MLGVLGEIFTSARAESSSSSSSSSSSLAAVASSGEAGAAEPYNIFFPGANATTAAAASTTRRQQQQQPRGGTGAGDGGGGVAGGLAGSNIRLRTLILGRCGGVSEAAFEIFFAQASRGVVMGARESSGARPGGGSGGGAGGGGGGGGGGGRSRGDAAATGFGLALSTVRLQGCRALGDRGLALLCAGAKRLNDVQVCASARRCVLLSPSVDWLCPFVLKALGNNDHGLVALFFFFSLSLSLSLSLRRLSVSLSLSPPSCLFTNLYLVLCLSASNARPPTIDVSGHGLSVGVSRVLVS